jgi:hypothetical protein
MLITAAHQQITREWWDLHRIRYDLFISPLVLEEAARGDHEAAGKRMGFLSSIPSLEPTSEALDLAEALIQDGALPPKAQDDAAHVAIAAVNNIDFLLTWNCRHIDNAEIKPLIRSICAIKGYRCPEICTPEELKGGEE